jgi:amino acid transporter
VSETTKSPVESQGEQPALRRVIGPKLLLLFVVGDILGTGVYALTGTVAGEVGGAAWMSFGLSFLVAMLTATSYIELVGKYPKAAGAALYTQRAFGVPFLSFLVAFAVVCSGMTSASAAARAFGGDYLSEFVELPTLLVAICFLLVLAAVNLRGVAESVKLNVVFTLVEVAGLILIIGIGAVAVSRGIGDPGRAVDFASGDNATSLVISGATLAFFAMVGFEDSVNMVEETKDPQRNFPRALFTGLCITGTIYILVALVCTILVPVGKLEKSTGPLLEVVKVGWTAFPLWVFSAVALFAVSNSALINMMMASRLVYGMSQDGLLPRSLGKVHPERRTPWVAIGLTTALAILVVSLGDIANLGGTTSLLLLCVFAIVNAAVLVLRREQVEHRHYRAPTALPVLGVICCAYLAAPFSGREGEQYRLAGILLLIGIGLWLVNWFAMRRTRAAAAPAEEPTERQ